MSFVRLFNLLYFFRSNDSFQQQCELSEQTAYFLNFDLNFSSKSLNASLYSSAAIALYKYWHVYFQVDRAPFTSDNQCLNRKTAVFDYMGKENGYGMLIKILFF